MVNIHILNQPTNLSNDFIDPRKLEYMAYSGQHQSVHAVFKRIPKEDRSGYANKYVFNQTIWGGMERLEQLLSVHADEAATAEKLFIDEVLNLFLTDCQKNGVYPGELFQSILYWSDRLVKLSLPIEALSYFNEATRLGIHKFPVLHLQLLNRMAQIFASMGKLKQAREILANLAEKPYLITDRNLVPEILFSLAKTALMIDEVNYYKRLLFLGLRHFYTNIEDRRQFVEQLTKTYRRFYRLLFNRQVNLSNKILFFIHWVYYLIPDLRRFHLGFINNLIKLGVLGYVYGLNYFRVNGELKTLAPRNQTELRISMNGSSRNGAVQIFRPKKIRQNILITRAMGGIGDLLMMTPGIHALKLKYPDQEIFLAIPKRYFPVFQNNLDVILIDIEKETFDYRSFYRWFNFSDCPASRVETRTAPNVRKNRIDIFAKSLGVFGSRLWQMDRRPRYFLTEEEKVFRKNFWQQNNLNGKSVIGIQLYADESYRDYPHMPALVQAIAKENHVLLFDAKPITGFNFENVTKIDRYSISKAFAIAGGCQALIGPDSAFVHLSAALNIPCIALFGPIDGKIRTKHYPLCQYLDAREQLGCVSCWRNEKIPCKLTNMRVSVCMGNISVQRIIAALHKKLNIKEKHYA